MSEEVKTVEIIEPEVITKEAPTKDDLKEKGWSEDEISSAEKYKLIKKEDKGPKENGTAPVETEDLNKKPEVVEEKKEEKARSTVPDFTLTPEKEKAFLEAFGPGTPQHGTYLRMKSERKARQAAEAHARELEARIQAMETAKPKQMEVDAEGNEIDPDDKPMTPKMFREMQAREAEERSKKEQEMNERAMRMAEAQKDQEDYARSEHPDYDDTLKLAKEVIQGFDTLDLPKWKQDKVRKLYADLRDAAANADKIDVDGYSIAQIGYEIGSLHPSYKNGHRSESHTDGKQDPNKANGGHTPEQMKRIEANTQRRASSASIPGGGGKRVVSAEDVTLAEFSKFDAVKRENFRKSHPEEYARIVRG